MGALDFIFGIILLIFVSLTILGGVAIRYDSQNLEKENRQLKEKLRKRQTKKPKKEDK